MSIGDLRSLPGLSRMVAACRIVWRIDVYQKTTLPNGLRILTSHMPHSRSVAACIFVASGSRYENDGEEGISHFLEHMLFKGTTKRPGSSDISTAVEQVGGQMNGSTDRELCSYWVRVAKPHFQQTLDVLVDMVRNPLIEPDEVDNERRVVQEELSMSNDYPDFRVERLIDEMLWPDQPMGRDIGGTRESVEGISRQMIVAWFQKQYGPANTVISIAGNLTHDEVLEEVAPLVEGWEGGEAGHLRPATYGEYKAAQVSMEHLRTEQAHVAMAMPGMSSLDPDRYALDMMSTVLGEGMSSRLFLEVREKRGLVYDIHSMVSHFRDTGSFAVYFGVEPKKAKFAVETILAEFARTKEGVPEVELSRARELAKGRLLLRMEDTRAVASWGGAQEMLYDRVLTVDDVVERVDAVTTDDIKRMANQFLLQEKVNLAVVGPYRSDRQFHAAVKS